jgi:hypothetical protein
MLKNVLLKILIDDWSKVTHTISKYEKSKKKRQEKL